MVITRPHRRPPPEIAFQKEAPCPTPLVVAEGLRKSYGDTQAVREVSLSVPAGSILGVLG